MSSVLDRIRRQRQQTEQSEQASFARKAAAAPTPAQVDAAAQATMSQNRIAPTGGSLVEKATAPRYTEVELPGIRDNTARKIDRLQNRMQSKPQDDTAERIRSLEQQAINYSNAGMTEQMLQVQKELDELKQSSGQGKLDALKAQRAEEKVAAWQAEQDKRAQDYVNLQAEKDFSTLAGQGMSAGGWSKEELEKRISETDMEISKLIASGQFEEADAKKIELDSLYKMQSMGKYGEDAERDTYSYLLAKDAQTGSNEAQEYLKFMENTMNYRQGKEQAEKIQGIESDILRPLAIGAHSVASGMANAGAGFNQLLNGDEPIATSPMQYASQEIQDDLGKVGKLLYGAGSSVGNMLPSVVLSAATGGLGASAAVAGGIGAAAMGASSAGNTYTQAVKEGYSPEQAKTYAALVGASEATLQYLLGGISKLGGVTDDVLLAKVSKLDNALARVAATGAVKLGSEIGEEELQLYLEPLIKSVVFGEEYKKPGFDEVLETALVTALSTGALEGKAILSSGKNTNAPRQMQTNTPNEDMAAKIAQGVQKDAAPAAAPDVSSVTEPAAHRQTAAQILNDGIFESPEYGEALQDTGLKRSDVKQALRDVSRGVITAQTDPNVQTVLQAIEGVDAQPAQVQTQVQAETPAAKAEDIMPRPAPAVDVDAAVNNVRAEGTGTVGDMGANPDDAQFAMGAADYGFSPYSNYQNTQSDFLPEGANAARPVDMPATDPMGRPVSRVASNLYGAQITTDDRRVQMELEFMQGAYGYDKKTNQAAVDRANATRKEDGYDRTYSRVVERLRDLKDLKQTMTDAILLYNEAIKNNKQEDAAELALLMTATGPEAGQLVQSFSLFRQLTPEGQLAGVQRVADRLNDKFYGSGDGKRNGGNPIPKYHQQEVENIINDVRESALQQLEGKKPKASKNTIGSKLAAIIDKNKNPAPQKERTAEQKILKDLEAFAKAYMDKKEPKFEYSSAKALERFLSNQEEYEDAWNDARWELQEKYADNPEMLDALNDFVTNNMGLEQIEKGIDRDIAKALRVFGIKTSDLVKMSADERANTANRVVRNLMMDSKLSAEDAAKARNFIVERFENRIAAAEERAAERAANRKHDPGLPVENWLDEIGNQVAAALDTAPKEQKPKPISKTIKQDVLRFAQEYKPKNATPKRTASDTLANYFANRDEYERAWNAAKKASGQEAFSNAGDMLGGTGTDSVMARAIVEEVAEQELKQKNINARMYLGDQANLENQIADSIIKKTGAVGEDQAFIRESVSWYLENKFDSRQTANSINYAIKDKLSSKAVDGVKLKISDIIRKSPGDKAAVAKKVAEMLVNDYGVSKEAAATVSENIVKQFNDLVAKGTESALKQRFGEKEKKQKKTFEQDFTELANMGAFTNANWKDAVSQKLFGHEITINPDLVEKFRNAPDQKTRDDIMGEIYENIGQQIPTTFAEAAKQWRYMSMLMNPSTHEKNITNNVSMMAMKLGKDVVGAGIESATNAVITAANKVTKGKIGNTKIDRTKSILNVFSKNDQKLMQTAWADFENVEDDVAGIGKHKDNAMGKIEEHRDYWKLNNPETKVAKALDKILRTAEKAPKFNSDLMNREDRWFSRPDYAISLAGYMKANNLTEITPEARLYAIKEAQKATFRDANAVSEFAMKMGTNGKWWNGIVNAIFPFKGTPANVGVRAVEYSPAGFLTTIVKAVKASKNGTFKAADFIDDLSANLVGSGLAAAGYFLAQAGLIRSTGVGDEKEKEAQKEAGYKDNSFKLFGYSVPETLITSISTPMFVGAAVYEALATKALDGEAYTIDDVLQAMAATTDPLVGQTMLEGLNDTIYAIRRTQGGPGEWGAAVAVNVAGNFIASFIPTLLSRISAAADGVSRETYVNKDSWVPDSVQKEIQDLMMKTPLRTKLPEKVDNYGRVQENWLSDSDTKIGKALGFVANVMTPTYPSEIKTTDVEAALQDVYRSGADVSDKKIFQTEAPKNITVDGKDVNLTAKQYEHFEKVRGDNTMEYQGGLQNHELFSGLNGDIQAAATDKMYEYIEQISKADLGLGYEPDPWVSELANATPEEVAKEVIGKALDSVGGYGDKSTEDIYRKAIYDPAWSVVDGDILDKAMEYATEFNDAVTKEQMGYEMDADWMLEAKAMGIHAGRTDCFIKKAVEAQAEKVGEGKYDGLGILLENGEITGKAALLTMPDDAVDAYNKYCADKYVSAEDWVDVYGYMNKVNDLDQTLEYIDKVITNENQRTAVAQAISEAKPKYVPVDNPVSKDWLLKHGDTDAVIAQFSESQEELYAQHIKGSKIDMGDYLDIWSYRYGGGGEIEHDQEEVVAKIKASGYDRDEQIRIFLAVGYSKNSIKKFWK